ncbi:MAG: 3-deoxy-8-phosphooctulonate synthase, partial [Alphaproteobacteria bacterium]|nr:3-deoxy-8-phosphooctulonate synthase [Alphaproteobacteria bacterium]
YASLTAGIAGVFIETHKDPESAPSDGANMIALKDLKKVLLNAISFDKVAKEINR